MARGSSSHLNPFWPDRCNHFQRNPLKRERSLVFPAVADEGTGVAGLGKDGDSDKGAVRCKPVHIIVDLPRWTANASVKSREKVVVRPTLAEPLMNLPRMKPAPPAARGGTRQRRSRSYVPDRSTGRETLGRPARYNQGRRCGKCPGERHGIRSKRRRDAGRPTRRIIAYR